MKNIKLAYTQDDEQNQTGLLYKYVSEERYSILKDGLIRFTQPQEFNDPFELKPIIKTVYNENEIKEGLEKTIEEVIRNQFIDQPETQEKENNIQKLLQIAMQENNKNILLSEIEKGMELLPSFIQKDIRDSFENHIGILSLTENDRNLLMWAHYANSHKGFVIEFNGNHPYFDQRKSPEDSIRHLRRVDYKKHRPKLELPTEANIDNFTAKGEEWAYEEEWRMLSMLEDSDKTIIASPYNIHLFKIPFSAMISVIFGARTSEETKNKIKIIIRNNSDLNHINTYGMKIHDSKFKLIKSHESISNSLSRNNGSE